MLASDVITQLKSVLPLKTDEFTTSLKASSVTRSGTTVTVLFSTEPGVSAGQSIIVTGAVVPIAISTLTRSGIVGTLVTGADHDLTNGIAPTITISGADEAVFNGTFTRVNVDNRRTIRFTMANSGATSATGASLLGASNTVNQYDGIHVVTSTVSLGFEYRDLLSGLPDPEGTIIVEMVPRISGAVDFERAADSYTAQSDGDYWMFVVMEDVVASKARSIDSDAVDNQQRGNEFRQQIVDGFSLYVFIPTSATIAAREAVDGARGVFGAICQSVLFHQFPTGLFSATHGAAQFVSHGVEAYNTAFYVHRFSFQQTIDLTFEDTVGPDADVAFRDINMTFGPDTGTAEFDADVDLDDTPL